MLMIYTQEAYPTLVTTSGFGLGNAVCRLASIVTPSIGQMLLDTTSILTTFTVYAVGFALAALVSTLLPFETLGRNADAVEKATAKEPSEATPLKGPAKA